MIINRPKCSNKVIILDLSKKYEKNNNFEL